MRSRISGYSGKTEKKSGDAAPAGRSAASPNQPVQAGELLAQAEGVTGRHSRSPRRFAAAEKQDSIQEAQKTGNRQMDRKTTVWLSGGRAWILLFVAEKRESG